MAAIDDVDGSLVDKDVERTAWNVLVSPLDDEHVVAALRRAVGHCVLGLASMTYNHFITWNARSSHSNQQHVVTCTQQRRTLHCSPTQWHCATDSRRLLVPFSYRGAQKQRNHLHHCKGWKIRALVTSSSCYGALEIVSLLLLKCTDFWWINTIFTCVILFF